MLVSYCYLSCYRCYCYRYVDEILRLRERAEEWKGGRGKWGQGIWKVKY